MRNEENTGFKLPMRTIENEAIVYYNMINYWDVKPNRAYFMQYSPRPWVHDRSIQYEEGNVASRGNSPCTLKLSVSWLSCVGQEELSNVEAQNSWLIFCIWLAVYFMRNNIIPCISIMLLVKRLQSKMLTGHTFTN